MIILFDRIQIQRKCILRIMPRFTLDAVVSRRHLPSLIADSNNFQKSFQSCNFILFVNICTGTSETELYRPSFFERTFSPTGLFCKGHFSPGHLCIGHSVSGPKSGDIMHEDENPRTFCKGHFREDICIRIRTIR